MSHYNKTLQCFLRQKTFILQAFSSMFMFSVFVVFVLALFIHLYWFLYTRMMMSFLHLFCSHWVIDSIPLLFSLIWYLMPVFVYRTGGFIALLTCILLLTVCTLFKLHLAVGIARPILAAFLPGNAGQSDLTTSMLHYCDFVSGGWGSTSDQGTHVIYV